MSLAAFGVSSPCNTLIPCICGLLVSKGYPFHLFPFPTRHFHFHIRPSPSASWSHFSCVIRSSLPQIIHGGLCIAKGGCLRQFLTGIRPFLKISINIPVGPGPTHLTPKRHRISSSLDPISLWCVLANASSLICRIPSRLILKVGIDPDPPSCMFFPLVQLLVGE
jgi:hypothetical protein